LSREGRISSLDADDLLLCSHEQSTWIPPQGPVAPSVGRTSEPHSVAILGQKIALISALVLLGRSRCRVLLTLALLALGSLAGRFPLVDEPVRPCLTTQTLGWPPLCFEHWGDLCGDNMCFGSTCHREVMNIGAICRKVELYRDELK
jgi:hypothetical protein